MSQLFHEWIVAMRAGDYERAWGISEQQRAAALAEGGRRDDPALPYHLRWVWDGGEIDGRDVLVRCYHGLGDTIQFLRFLPALRERAASVTLEIQPRLIPLLGGGALADRVLPFDPARPTAAAECDVEIMELPQVLRMPPAAIEVPYLCADPAGLAPGTIGICRRAGDWDASRSIAPELLAPLCRDRTCIALDPGPSALPVVNPQGCPFDIVKTAELIAGASLVMAVDTMVAHLAGALGRPAWLLLKHEPDWRWTPQLGRSEWYPSMRLYAQPRPGDWASVVAAVQRDLDHFMPQRSLRDEREQRLSLCPGVLGRTARQDHNPANQA